MRLFLAAAVSLLAISLSAAEYEKYLLPISPSVVFCGHHSRYETTLVAYNGNVARGARLCTGTACDEILPQRAQEFRGGFAGGLPLPAFVYLPKASAESLNLSLQVESSERSRPAERSFTDLPVIRADQFTTAPMQFIGVRVDPGFRQTVRIYGLDASRSAKFMMRVYSLDSNELLHNCEHDIHPISAETTVEGLPLRPAFGMECNMSDHLEADGKKVRIELESLTPGIAYWAFISIANNQTQAFYTVFGR